MRRRPIPRLAAVLGILAAVSCSSQPTPKPAPATSASAAPSAPAILHTNGYVQQKTSETGTELRIEFTNLIQGHIVEYRLAPADTVVTDGVVRVVATERGPILEVIGRGEYHARYPEAGNVTLAPCWLTCTGGACGCQLSTCRVTGHICKYVEQSQSRYCTCASP